MKSLIVDQIEITRSGIIQIRMHKLSSDGDMLGNHRTAIEPGGDVDAQFAAVSAHMAQEGFAPVSAEDIDRVKEHTVVAHTSAVIAAYKEARLAAPALAAVK